MTGVTVNPDRKVQRTIKVKGVSRKVNFVEVICECGVKWLVRSDSAKRVQMCYQCSQTAKAKKGYAATAAKHGKRFALRHLREWRLQNPTCLERIVVAWLDDLGLSYEREYYFVTGDGDVRLLDFLVNSRLVIEANGKYWHEKPETMARDGHKLEALRYAGFDVLVLSESEITNGEGYQRLKSHLAIKGQ